MLEPRADRRRPGDRARPALRRDQPGPYQLQAAINAVHADADAFEETDWSQIVALYDQLLEAAPTPVVALNRAIAIGELEGPSEAARLVGDLDLEGYQPFHAAQADLLRRLGRTAGGGEGVRTCRRARRNDAERDFLQRGGRGGAPEVSATANGFLARRCRSRYSFHPTTEDRR